MTNVASTYCGTDFDKRGETPAKELNEKPVSAVDAAHEFIQRGWSPIPVMYGEKNAVVTGWQSLRIGSDSVAQYICARSNIGLILGEPSGFLVDIDLDSPEAIAAAPHILPPTGMKHGRQERPASHYWYIAEKEPGYKKYADPCSIESKNTLIELRGKSGHYTVVPPSTYGDGQALEWIGTLDPSTVDSGDIARKVMHVAVACLATKYLWASGNRHGAALSLSGLLCQCKVPESDAVAIIAGICAAADDEEVLDRISALESTYQKYGSGHPIQALSAFDDDIPKKVVGKILEWLGGPRPLATVRPSAQAKSGATKAYEILAPHILDKFCDRSGRPFLSVDWHGHHIAIAPGELAAKARILYRAETGVVPEKGIIDNAIEQFAAEASASGMYKPVNVRIALHDSAIYVDLGDETEKAVRITAAGWEVIDDPPVTFLRSMRTGALPVPEKDPRARIQDLRSFIKVRDDDWPLLIGFICGTFHPVGGIPLLVLSGEQGTAKSTTSRMLKKLIDPSDVDLRTQPAVNDVITAASGNFLLVYDNQSKISPELSDLLCGLSTGTATSKRKLYTDNEEYAVSFHRPVILNGIGDLVYRSDLMDRCLMITLSPIPPGERMAEEELWFCFNNYHPVLLGKIYDCLAEGLRSLPIHLPEKPRMADFAEWSVACEQGAGMPAGSFLTAYTLHTARASEALLATHPLAPALLKWIKTVSAWEGTAQDLKTTLQHYVEEKNMLNTLPVNARTVGDMLREISPNLRKAGIAISEHKSGHNTHWLIRYAPGREAR